MTDLSPSRGPCALTTYNLNDICGWSGFFVSRSSLQPFDFFYPLVLLRERNTSIGGVWTASYGVESQSRQLGSANLIPFCAPPFYTYKKPWAPRDMITTDLCSIGQVYQHINSTSHIFSSSSSTSNTNASPCAGPLICMQPFGEREETNNLSEHPRWKKIFLCTRRNSKRPLRIDERVDKWQLGIVDCGLSLV